MPLWDVECALHARRYDLFCVQMMDLRHMIKEQYSEESSSEVYLKWFQALDSAAVELNKLISALETWFQAQPQDVQGSIEMLLQYDNKEFQEQLHLYLTPEGRRSLEQQQQSSRSSSSRSSSSVRVLSGLNIPLSEEPESTQLESQNGQSTRHQAGQRRPGGEDSSGNWSASIVSSRPLAKEKARPEVRIMQSLQGVTQRKSKVEQHLQPDIDAQPTWPCYRQKGALSE